MKAWRKHNKWQDLSLGMAGLKSNQFEILELNEDISLDLASETWGEIPFMFEELSNGMSSPERDLFEYGVEIIAADDEAKSFLFDTLEIDTEKLYIPAA